MENVNDKKDRTANIKRMLDACNDISGVIADDILILKENGNDDEIDNRLQMLGSKKNKTYERFLSLIREIKHFKFLVDFAKELDLDQSGKEIEPIPEEKPKGPKAKRNIQDFVH